MTVPVVTYPITLVDLTHIADAACELDAYKDMLADKPIEQARVRELVGILHSLAERAAGAACDLVYQPEEGPMLDYEAIKQFYFTKGAADFSGRGRFESAFYHTVLMVFEQGLRAGEGNGRQQKALATLAKYFTSGNCIPVDQATIKAVDFWRITGMAHNACGEPGHD
jgi:hypothetical protein